MTSFDKSAEKMGVLNPEVVNIFREGGNKVGMGRIEDAPQSEYLWMCTNCGKSWKDGKFCSECGAPRPKGFEGWLCSCGSREQGDFCSVCGNPKPVDVCGRCGWKPKQGAEPLAYCPECGYVIKKDKSKPVKIPDCQWG